MEFKNAYIIDSLSGELTLIELTSFTAILDTVFLKRGALNQKQMVIAKDFLIDKYEKEIEYFKSIHKENNNYFGNFYHILGTFVEKYHIKDKKNTNWSGHNFYLYLRDKGFTGSIQALSYNISLNIVDINCNMLLSKKELKEIRSRNLIFLLDKLFTLYMKKCPMLVNNKLVDYTEHFDFKEFIKFLAAETKDRSFLKFNLANYRYLNEKYSSEIIIEKEMELREYVSEEKPVKQTHEHFTDPEEIPF